MLMTSCPDTKTYSQELKEEENLIADWLTISMRMVSISNYYPKGKAIHFEMATPLYLDILNLH